MKKSSAERVCGVEGPESPAGGGAPAVAETGAAVKDRPKTAPPKVDQLPPYRVLLHNDDVNTDVHVVRSIVELTPLDKLQAVAAMQEAHSTGVALLVVTHRERAELYRDQFQSKSLTVTIEPAA